MRTCIKEVLIFIKENKTLTCLSICSVIVIILFTLFSNNFSEDSLARKFMELIFQIAIAIFANLMFYIFQLYIPNRRKEKVVRPYMIGQLKKLLNLMNEMMTELARVYCPNCQVNFGRLEIEHFKCITEKISLTDSSTIQIAFVNRNMTIGEIMEQSLSEINEIIRVLMADFLDTLDADCCEIIIAIQNSDFQKRLFSQNFIRLTTLFGAKGISGNAAISTFQKYQELYNKLASYIKEHERRN